MIPFVYKLGGAALFIACAWLYVTDLRHDRDAARTEAARAQQAERTATAQAGLNTSASQAVEAAQSRALTITVKASELSHAVSVAPGGPEPVPSSVLELWRAGIGELRDEAAASHGAPGSSSPDVAGAVSPSTDAK